MKNKFHLKILGITFTLLFSFIIISRSETMAKQFYINSVSNVVETKLSSYGPIYIKSYKITANPILFDKNINDFRPSLNNLNFEINIATTNNASGWLNRIDYLSKISVKSPFTCLGYTNGVYSGNIPLSVTFNTSSINTRTKESKVYPPETLSKNAPFTFDPLTKKGSLQLDIPFLFANDGLQTHYIVTFIAAQDPNPTPTPLQSPCRLSN